MLPGPANRSKSFAIILGFFQTDCGGIVMLDEVRRKNEAGIGFLVKAGFEVIEEKEWTMVLKWSAQAEGGFE